MKILLLEPEEYDFLMEMLDRPTRKPEEMPKMQNLLSMPSPFAGPEDKCTQ